MKRLVFIVVAILLTTPALAKMESPPPLLYEPGTGDQKENPDAELLAKVLWGEARGVESKTEQAAGIWCVLNRVDSDGYGCGTSIEYVVTFPKQFLGYSPDNQVDDELYKLAVDVLDRWELEKSGAAEAGRVLPKDCLWFEGRSGHNYFRNEYIGGTEWDWSLQSPYTNTTAVTVP